MSDKKWSIMVVVIIVFFLAILGGITVVIDPYFHYHKPLSCLEYPIYNERNQNDGIVRHFEYDALITGTSMTENFKTSEFDELFDVNSIKVPFAGAGYKELKENLERALEANEDLFVVLLGIDYINLLQDKDWSRFEEELYPSHLYDDWFYNDVKYLFNKTVLIEETLNVLSFTEEGGKTTSFDRYVNWNRKNVFGKDAVDKTYQRETGSSKEPVEKMSETDYAVVEATLEQNLLSLVRDNSQVTFYLFFTPYSIYYWDSLNQAGTLQKQLEAEQKAIEMLLEYDNIRLFSFFDEFDMICDLNNYKDSGHYGEWINSQILRWMKEGSHRLTKENYLEYCGRVYSFYTTYDYDALFAEAG